jgi:hypothetical protein
VLFLRDGTSANRTTLSHRTSVHGVSSQASKPMPGASRGPSTARAMDSECNRPAMLIAKAARSAGTRDGKFQGSGVIAASGKTINGAFPKSFVAAIAQHRFAEGPDLDAIVA